MPWLGRDAQGIDADRLESFRGEEYLAAVLQNVRFPDRGLILVEGTAQRSTRLVLQCARFGAGKVRVEPDELLAA